MTKQDCRAAHAFASTDGQTVTVTMGDGSYTVSREEFERSQSDDEFAPSPNANMEFRL